MFITSLQKKFIVVLFLIQTIGQLYAEEIQIQIVTEHAPPLTFQQDNSNTVEGIATELLQEVMHKAGITYQIQLLPWVRSYKKAMSDPNVLIYSIGRTAERENHFKWVGEIMPMEYGLYRYTKNEPSAPSSISNIKHKLIGVPRNDLRHQYLDKNGFTNLVFTNDYDQTYRLLTRGRINYFVASTLGVTQFIDRFNFSEEEIKLVLGFDKLKTGLYFAFSLQTDDRVIEKVRQSFEKIKTDGIYDRIMGRLLNRFESSKMEESTLH